MGGKEPFPVPLSTCEACSFCVSFGISLYYGCTRDVLGLFYCHLVVQPLCFEGRKIIALSNVFNRSDILYALYMFYVKNYNRSFEQGSQLSYITVKI